MTMTVKNNMSAVNTLNTLERNSSDLSKELQRLSSGMRINSAADDASAYAISERMRVQIRSLDQDLRNTQNARSLMRTAEGAVASTVEILKTFKEKALDAANDTNTDEDRATIQRELDQLIQQVDDNAYVTYNGKILLDGSMGGNIAGDEHGAIVDFMSYLDNSTLSAADALNKAINYASGGLFQDEEELKANFLADIKSRSDLLDKCGINLDNDDTGSITGRDAGNDREKTAESIVPEDGLPFGMGPAGSSTSVINGLTVIWPDTAGNAMKSAITSALDNQWLQNCMDLIDESYELNFLEPGASVRTMTVNLDASVPSGTLAQVKSTYNTATGVTTGLELQINMSYYSHLDLSDPNGLDEGSHQTYLDRVIAHEMTHALMAANITHFSDLKPYIKEGAAELTHGIDDERKNVIEDLAANPTNLKAALEFTGANPDEKVYAAGYMILRYLAKQSAEGSPQKKMVFQIGTKANQVIKAGLGDMRAMALGLKDADGTTLSVTTQKKATSALNVIDHAINKALKQQTFIGAIESRLDFTAANITTAHENVTASESTIRDADMAKTFTDYTKANVLMQTAQSMLAQANQNSSSALGLLQ